MRQVSVLLAVIAWLCLSSAAVAAEETLEVILQEENNSGVSGMATLRDNGNGTTTLRIELKGDRKGATHPAHLHEGTCKGTIPTIRYPIEDVVNGRSTTRVPASLQQLMEETLYINIHPSHEKLWPVITCGGLNEPRGVPETGGGAQRNYGPDLWSGLVLLGAFLAGGALWARRQVRA